MGILACDRKECENTMCEYLSNTYGYICDNCMEELIDRLYQDPLNMHMNIKEFMNTHKNTFSWDIDKNWIAEQVQNEFKFTSSPEY